VRIAAVTRPYPAMLIAHGGPIAGWPRMLPFRTTKESKAGEASDDAASCQFRGRGCSCGFRISRRPRPRRARDSRGVAGDDLFSCRLQLRSPDDESRCRRSAIEVSSFIAATLAALVVGKAVLVANRMPYIRRYDRAPLILPILFKTAFYSIVVFLVRLLERFVHFTLVEHHRPRGFVSNLLTTFSWDRFLALNLWICALFLVFVTATEVARFFTLASIERLFFTSRPSDLRLNRRRRIRELLLLSRLADERPISELRDPKSLAHREMIDCLERFARQ
jgi:hypothetical protein